MTAEDRRYLAYLVRLWKVDMEEEFVWRASAQSPHTGERHAFADLALLVRFLEEQTRVSLIRDAREPDDAQG